MVDRRKLERMAEVARLYYEEGKSQVEIGKMLHVSHSTISRLIQEAHQHNIVEVVIHHPFKSISSLSEALICHFGLKEAYVVPNSGNNDDQSVNNVAYLAAHVLMDKLQDGMMLGISGGKAVASTIRQIKVTQPMHVRVARLLGVTEEELDEGADLAQVLAKQLGNDAMIIPAPLVMRSVEACQRIFQEPSVSDAIHLAENADIGLIGIGSMKSGYPNLLKMGWINRDILDRLIMAGAVGEICGKYYDHQGQILDVDFNRRVVAIQIEKLANFDTVIGVTCGEEKAQAILGAVHAGWINVLVTDSDTARIMLELSNVSVEV
ncbi:MAG: sugar-binding transcriptional regulator [Anaerolineales bacterium]